MQKKTSTKGIRISFQTLRQFFDCGGLCIYLDLDLRPEAARNSRRGPGLYSHRCSDGTSRTLLQLAHTTGVTRPSDSDGGGSEDVGCERLRQECSTR